MAARYQSDVAQGGLWLFVMDQKKAADPPENGGSAVQD
jgi:hypothetical protein